MSEFPLFPPSSSRDWPISIWSFCLLSIDLWFFEAHLYHNWVLVLQKALWIPGLLEAPRLPLQPWSISWPLRAQEETHHQREFQAWGSVTDLVLLQGTPGHDRYPSGLWASTSRFWLSSCLLWLGLGWYFYLVGCHQCWISSALMGVVGPAVLPVTPHLRLGDQRNSSNRPVIV